MQFMADAVLRYQGYLSLAEDFLLKKYGITRRSAEAAKLGVVCDPYAPHRAYDRRLCLPSLDAHGAPQSLKFRCLSEHDCKDHGHPKYLGTEGSSPRLSGVQCLIDDTATTLYVVEGELDQIVMAHEMGLACVGYPGTAMWDPTFTRAVGPDWQRIVVVCDGDEPGRMAGKKVAKELKADIVQMPDGEDVSSLYVKRGRRGLEVVLGIESEPEEIPL